MNKVIQKIKNKMPLLKLQKDKYENKKGSKIKPENYQSYLENWYQKYTGEKMDLNNPINYTQKIQWLKLHESTQEKADLADKYKVREWVKNKIGSEYLIPLIGGPYYSADEIDFEKLPNRFVIKANHGCGWNICVKDKKKLNIKITKYILNEWLKLDFSKNSGLELHYSMIKPCLIIEQYMENMSGDLTDYKFLCFNGKPYYCWVDVGRYKNHRRNIYNLNWELQDWILGYENSDTEIPKPENFSKMIEIVEKLCQGFNHVRVDLYNIDGKIYFGEMTFTSGSGRKMIYPKEMNVELGNLIDIKK